MDAQEVCDTCGGTVKPFRSITAYSKLVVKPSAGPGLLDIAGTLPSADTGFCRHDFSVCRRCDRRKILIVAAIFAALAALGVVAYWQPLAFIPMVLLLPTSYALARTFPERRLRKRIIEERFAALRGGCDPKRVVVEILTADEYGSRPVIIQRSPGFVCRKCGSQLEEIGVPPEIQFVQSYANVIDVGGGEEVLAEIKADPFLYRAFYCPFCSAAFCPRCSGMQYAKCPRCGLPGLLPAYRPLLRKIQ